MLIVSAALLIQTQCLHPNRKSGLLALVDENVTELTSLKKFYVLRIFLLRPWTPRGKHPERICRVIRYHGKGIRGTRSDSSQPPNDPAAAFRLRRAVPQVSLKSAEPPVVVRPELLTHHTMHRINGFCFKPPSVWVGSY